MSSMQELAPSLTDAVLEISSLVSVMFQWQLVPIFWKTSLHLILVTAAEGPDHLCIMGLLLLVLVANLE